MLDHKLFIELEINLLFNKAINFVHKLNTSISCSNLLGA